MFGGGGRGKGGSESRRYPSVLEKGGRGGGEGKCEPLIYTYVKELGAR